MNLYLPVFCQLLGDLSSLANKNPRIDAHFADAVLSALQFLGKLGRTSLDRTEQSSGTRSADSNQQKKAVRNDRLAPPKKQTSQAIRVRTSAREIANVATEA